MNYTVASSGPWTQHAMTIKYPKNFFGHPEANTLSDINITREDIVDAIKTIAQNSSKRLAHPLQLLYIALLKIGEISINLK